MSEAYNKNSLSSDYFENELHEILAWWMKNMTDKSGEGFIGRITGNNEKMPSDPRSIILYTRILWSFSAAARLSNNHYEKTATLAYKYILEHFLDTENGGFYWMLDSNGNKLNGKKQVYAQAFGIYALTEYYLLTGDEKALNVSLDLFNLLENHALDKKHNGYFEAFAEDWSPIDNVALSEKEGNDAKTMNTHLHILECYTNLFRCSNDIGIRDALENLINVYLEKFIGNENGRLKLFFDEEWNENKDHDSFGHEIESAWLLNEAVNTLGQKILIYKSQKIGERIAERVLELGYSPIGGIYNKRNLQFQYEEVYDWWPQAEAVIGFYDAFQNSKHEKFLEASVTSWKFINFFIKDEQNGEWFWACDERGEPILLEDKAGPWKAPYHNSRMCMEMMKRIK